MTNLQLRLISAVILAPVVITAIIIGGKIFAAFVALIFLIACYEWTSISLKTNKKLAFLALGLVYLPICFFEFYFLRNGFENGLYYLLTMMIVVWAGDTGAYFVGRKFGKHKMAPNFSPNKSWEGLAGSMLFSGVFLWLCIYFAPALSTLIANSVTPPTGVQSLSLFIMGCILGYVGQAGDLLESAMKRKANVKDSGRIIPGHGGILDRVDSILLISPVFVFIASHVL